MDAANCKRVNVAGSQSATYLQRLLQLKYPGHLAAITLSRVEELLHEHSYAAVDYHEGANDVIVAGGHSAWVETRAPINFPIPLLPQRWKSGAVQSFTSGRFTACSFPSQASCRAAV